MGTVTVLGRDEVGRLTDVTLTTTTDLDPPGPESLASVQTVRLLGPFHIVYTDLDEGGGNFLLIEELAAGTVVVSAWAVLAEGFDENPIGVQVSIVDELAFTEFRDAYVVNNADGSGDLFPLGIDLSLVTTTPATDVKRQPALATATINKLAATIFAEADEPTEGSVDIYALIAEPAA